MINATMVADSLNQHGNRLSTVLITLPRYILAELNTHRMLSKNSASSRAIPFRKMVQSVKDKPFIPIAWQKDHTGMQGTEYFKPTDGLPPGARGNISYIDMLEKRWLVARDNAVQSAEALSKDIVTKQLCNRLLEPFMWHTVLISGTEWENFFALRCPNYKITCMGGEVRYYRSRKDAIKGSEMDIPFDTVKATELDWLGLNIGMADIHMMALAEAMWDCMNESTPKQLQVGEWHIPFGEQINFTDDFWATMRTAETMNADKVKIATARCAQTSYTIVGEEGKALDYQKLVDLHDRLRISGHMSPFEHCAKAMTDEEYNVNINGEMVIDNQDGIIIYDVQDINCLGWKGNFRGFIQYRKMLSNENITK
jgi:hypothetical protein